MIKITLDTSIIRDKRKLTWFIDRASAFDIRFYVSDFTLLEWEKDENFIAKRVAKFEMINRVVVGETLPLPHEEFFEKAYRILGRKPKGHKSTTNDLTDVSLLFVHHQSGNDYFLTMNKTDFLDNRRQDRFEKELGIKIRFPDENFLRELKAQHDKSSI